MAGAGSFQSKRLIYRSLDSPEDKFLHQLLSDPIVMEYASMEVHRPIDQKKMTQLRTSAFDESVLSVVFCKKPDGKSDGTTTVEATDGGDQSSSAAAAATTTAVGGGGRGGRSEETPVGVLVLNTGPSFEFHHRAAKLGIMVKSEHQGHSYGPEAIEWALEWAFVSAGLHRVDLNVAGWNHRAIRVYEKIGFVKEGSKREALWKDGKWWDCVTMGILQKEWAAKHGVEIAS